MCQKTLSQGNGPYYSRTGREEHVCRPLYTRNLLDQKSSIFEPKGKVSGVEDVSNVKLKQLTHNIRRWVRSDISGEQ